MRRSSICALAAALVLFTGSAQAAAPKVSEFGMAIPTAVTARAASGQIVTRVLRAPHRYDMVGAEWSSGSGTVSLRGRAAGGHWSRWRQLDESEQAIRHGVGTEPIWAGGYDYVQLRTSRPLPGLHLHFVRIDRGASASRAPRTVQVPTPGGGTLQVVPRAAWGATRCKPRATAGYGHVNFTIVHHTTTLNGYRRSDSPAIVLGICLFHRDVNGWNDVGYNMLVDKYGQVFEGRKGGIDEPVVGAQAGGFNLWSSGIATLGNFSYSRLSAAGVDALAHVLAWKMSLSGIPADGKTTVISDGGPNTPFSQGTTVTVNRISGHRDVDSTACPGNALYGQLPQLRQQVAGLEGPVSQLALSTPSSTVVFPGQLVVTGKLTPPAGMTIPAGATVQIQDRLAAGGRTLTTLPLAADGSYAGSLPMAHNDVVRALYTGDGSLPRVAAAPVYAAVVPVLTLQASAQTVAAGSVVTLSGTVAPAKRRVVLEEQVSRRGAFRRARLIKVGVTSGGFKRDVKLARAGSYHFIVRAPADRLTAAGASASIAVGAA